VQTNSNKFHHKPGVICIICTLNALTDSVYLLIDSQESLWELYPKPSHPKYRDHSWAMKTFFSSSTHSIDYLINSLLNQGITEFEAFSSVVRNLIERLTKLIEINKNKEKLIISSCELKNTIKDITLIFECRDLKNDINKLKKEKFLNSGTNWDNLPEDKYKLAFTYLSRLIHSYNMDSLLNSTLDKFLIRGYLLVLVSELYYKVSSELHILSDETRLLHSTTHTKLNKIWSKNNTTSETLIYWTTFYNNKHTRQEKEILTWYENSLVRCVDFFENRNGIILPKIEIIEHKDQ
jgi:hypothetical protein